MSTERQPVAAPAGLTALHLALGAELADAIPLSLLPQEARARASDALDPSLSSEDDRRVAREFLAVELLCAARPALLADIAAARRLLARVEEEVGVHHAVLARGLLRAPDLLTLPPAEALAAQLRLMLVLAPLDEVSLWRRDPDGAIECVADGGGRSAGYRGAAALAAAGLGEPRGETVAGDLLAARIAGPDAAVLIARSDPIFHAQARSLVHEVAPLVAATLEREHLHGVEREVDRRIAEARDRRLIRLGLDVHDGPLQDLAALAQDLRLFRDQLGGVLAGHERDSVMRGRMDDLEAQLVAVDAELRRLAVSLQSPFLNHHDLGCALTEMIESFSLASGLKPSLELIGDLEVASDSQQMALLSVIRESLNNIREHSDATVVSVRVAADAAGIRADVTDDGSGFDVETSLLRAAREGRLGLVGMQERVRLLDGRSWIDSRPGGPTRVTIELPRWTG